LAWGRNRGSESVKRKGFGEKVWRKKVLFTPLGNYFHFILGPGGRETLKVLRPWELGSLEFG